MQRRIACSFATALALAACHSAEPPRTPFRSGVAAPDPEPGTVRVRAESERFVHVETVGESRVPTLLRAPGRIRFRGDGVSEIGAPLEGRVTEVHVRVGDRVERGQALITLASASAASMRADLAEARVIVEAARTEVERQREMASNGVGVAVQRMGAEAELARAEALLSGLESSARSIGRGSAASIVLRAPISGAILELRATVGVAVTAGSEPLAVVGEASAIQVEVGVFERDVPLLRVGAHARVRVSSVADPLEAVVSSIGGAVDPATHRAPVYLTLTASPEGSVRAGMHAHASIEAAASGFGIPSSAVLVKEGGRTVVYVATGARTYAARDVHVGATVDGRVPVFDGLSRGERVVVQGALLLDGAAGVLR